MTDKKDSKSGTISQADAALWKAVTKDVRRLGDLAHAEGEDLEEDGAVLRVRETVMPEVKAKRTASKTGQGVDGRTEERLRKGQMEIEARLDLHGMYQDEACAALKAFIRGCYMQGKRCVLVITGKGSTKRPDEEWWETQPGVLKQRVPEWLADADMKPFVLRFVPAARKDGGEGALYVLLRRRR